MRIVSRSWGRARRRIGTSLAALLVLGAAMAGGTQAEPLVVASIHPYADLLEQIAGDRVKVVQLLPSGASPHTFDPSPSQARAVAGAALVVMNGGIDDWAKRLVSAAAPHAARFVVTERLTYVPIQAADGGIGNPHVWLDPTLMEALVPELVGALSEVSPADADVFRANGERLLASLRQLDHDLTAALAPYRGAPFVPFHDAWPYFARHFGLDLVVSIEPAPGREPSPRAVADAVARIQEVGAVAVFDERQLNPRPAQVVAAAAGVPVVTLDPLGGPDESYQQVLRANVAAIVGALDTAR